jgi:hypothetical protein
VSVIGGIVVKRLVGLLLLLGFVGLLVAGAPERASADFCLQFSGTSCDLSGALGFFRFKGKLPKKVKKFAALHGRACGVGPTYGSAVLNTEGTGVEVGATFFCDAEQGQISALFTPGSGIGDTSLLAYASYGTHGLATSCTATIVDCNLEP